MKTLLFIALLSLVGCASMPKGIEASSEELKACEQEGCSVWTKDELEHAAKQMFLRGFVAGRGKES